MPRVHESEWLSAKDKYKAQVDTPESKWTSRDWATVMIIFKNILKSKGLTASIIDPPQTSLDPSIWCNNILCPAVEKFIFSILHQQYREVLGNYRALLIEGSLATYQWRSDSDLDVAVYTMVSDSVLRSLGARSWQMEDLVLIPDTTHPLNFYFWPPSKQLHPTAPTYNILSSSWLESPSIISADEVSQDLLSVTDLASHWVNRLKPKIRMLSFDYQDIQDILHSSSPIVLRALQGIMESEAAKVFSEMISLREDYELIHGARKESYDPIEVAKRLQEGRTRDESEANLLYKVLEHNHYIEYLRHITKALEQVGV